MARTANVWTGSSWEPIVAAPMGGGWVDYTPALSGTAGWALGDGTAVGRYTQTGNTVSFSVRITFGSTSTFGTGSVIVSLPIVRNTSTPARFPATLTDSGAWFYFALGLPTADGLGAQITAMQSSPFGSMSDLTATFPLTWGASDAIAMSGTYEAAGSDVTGVAPSGPSSFLLMGA